MLAAEVTGPDAAEAVRTYPDAVEVPRALKAFPVGKSALIAEVEHTLPGMAVLRVTAPPVG